MGVLDTMRGIDDRLLGERMKGRDRAMDEGSGKRADPRAALAGVLRIFYRICKLVFVLLALVVLLGIVFTKAPVNARNDIVRTVLRLARDVAGPFRDVFAPKDKENALVVNYLLAAAVYFGLSVLVRKLPTGAGRTG